MNGYLTETKRVRRVSKVHFLTLWEDADTDIPLLIAAKAQCANRSNFGAHNCDAGVTQNLPTLLKLTSLMVTDNCFHLAWSAHLSFCFHPTLRLFWTNESKRYKTKIYAS